MGLEITGKLHAIFATAQVSERFMKREFVVELTDNPKYPQLVMFQLTGGRVTQLDDLKVGDSVQIEFSLRGREWKSPRGEVKFFNSLDVWRIELAPANRDRPPRERSDRSQAPRNDGPPPVPPATGYGTGLDDDIPFLTCELGTEPSPIWRPFRA